MFLQQEDIEFWGIFCGVKLQKLNLWECIKFGFKKDRIRQKTWLESSRSLNFTMGCRNLFLNLIFFYIDINDGKFLVASVSSTHIGIHRRSWLSNFDLSTQREFIRFVRLTGSVGNLFLKDGHKCWFRVRLHQLRLQEHQDFRQSLQIKKSHYQGGRIARWLDVFI